MENIYLSGPMNGHEDNNFELFHEAQLHYEKKGYNVLNPHLLGINLEHKHLAYGIPLPNYMQYLAYDLHIMMLSADIISLLPGWNNGSFGTKMEIITAVAKPGIQFIEYPNDHIITFEDIYITFDYKEKILKSKNDDEKAIQILQTG